jgi:hypothetical protein
MLSDYLSASSIHGLGYLASGAADGFGKIFWVLCLTASFSFATLIIVGNIQE